MAKRALLILDACVLIDFWDADPSVLGLVARHVGKVHVAENVLSEAKRIARAEAMDAGLIVVEPSTGGSTVKQNGKMDWAADGSSGHGFITLVVTAPGYDPCRSTYEVTAVRL